jgi:hypothetical protein
LPDRGSFYLASVSESIGLGKRHAVASQRILHCLKQLFSGLVDSNSSFSLCSQKAVSENGYIVYDDYAACDSVSATMIKRVSAVNSKISFSVLHINFFVHLSRMIMPKISLVRLGQLSDLPKCLSVNRY